MTKLIDGGPAFARSGFTVESNHEGMAAGGFACVRQDGMTLRDYFAIRAPLESIEVSRELVETWCEALARVSYEYADAMLKVRAQKDLRGGES